MNSLTESSEFNPARFLTEHALTGDPSTPDLLILNQPIADFAAFAHLWKQTRYRICADGGANRLYDMCNGDHRAQRADYLPSAIHGDLDSLRDDVREYYAVRGVEITQDHDQYSTDFGKAMNKIRAVESSSPQREVLVLGTLGGRVDQGLGLLHEMIREHKQNPTTRLWLFSERSVSFILGSRHNTLKGLKSEEVFTKYVGIIPIYGPAVISTSGLEWNVEAWDTSMGTQVSANNHVVEDEVKIDTNVPVLFTIERKQIAVESQF
ncbi:thiamine pyrophosphokinase-like protein 1 [Lophiotrema nucula]|uniref:Thiamine pyrophosphokinase n=1 Tax=Lophiotrema nucula TaxID=690887 RepID=A0A6A5YUM0_9PLEO|nr:thiamine pyrophosphokinase-like protein 1 [Lophiotrema nucula]